MTNAQPTAHKKPPAYAFLVIFAIAVSIGMTGVILLQQSVVENTTAQAGEYKPGDCRVFERTIPGLTHEKYRMAKACMMPDGSWDVVETAKKKPIENP